MAPEVGFEPTTGRLTAVYSTTELLRNNLKTKTSNHVAGAVGILNHVTNAQAVHGKEPFNVLFWTHVTNVEHILKDVSSDVTNMLVVAFLKGFLNQVAYGLIKRRLNLHTQQVLRNSTMIASSVDGVNLFIR